LGVSPPGYRTYKVLLNIVALLFFRFSGAQRVGWTPVRLPPSPSKPYRIFISLMSGRFLKIRPWKVCFQALHLEYCKRHSHWQNHEQENAGQENIKWRPDLHPVIKR
jgi:hypothetical protein